MKHITPTAITLVMANKQSGGGAQIAQQLAIEHVHQVISSGGTGWALTVRS